MWYILTFIAGGIVGLFVVALLVASREHRSCARCDKCAYKAMYKGYKDIAEDKSWSEEQVDWS